MTPLGHSKSTFVVERADGGQKANNNEQEVGGQVRHVYVRFGRGGSSFQSLFDRTVNNSFFSLLITLFI